ncbi:MAG: VCBS repeat-containing protein [Myxococcales bacterium]|nr:VCBS repeat-containing protein [Myxococcales bacterium]
MLAPIGCQEGDLAGHAAGSGLERAVLVDVTLDLDPWPDGIPSDPQLIEDLDGDGWLDIVAGQYGGCVSNCLQPPGQQVHQPARLGVWRGGPAGFPVLPTAQWSSTVQYESLRVVAVVGDTDGDGVRELVLTAEFASDPQLEEGRVFLVPVSGGVPGAPSWTIQGLFAGVRLGTRVEPLGDVDGDGYDDLLVGLPYGGAVAPSADGRAIAYYGGPGGFRQVPDWVSPALGYRAGEALAAGDLDGDGYPDAFVAAPDDGRGKVWGFRGGPAGLSAAPSWMLAASDPDDKSFGRDLRVIPDVDGDGYAELMVSTPDYGPTNVQWGRVEVFRGSPLGPVTPAAWAYAGTEVNDNLGASIAVGDLDADGRVDLVMSLDTVWSTAGGQFDGAGGAAVVHGVPGGLAATSDYTLRCDPEIPCTPMNGPVDVVRVADLDGNGYDDVVLAGSANTPYGTGWIQAHGANEGSAQVVYGGPDTDGDGAPDAADCAPADPTIHPGADEIGYDGVDQDCRGDDDYDLDLDGAQASPWGFDPDDQDPRVTFMMAVGGSCQTSMTFTVDGITPGATVELYSGNESNGYSDFYPPHPCDPYDIHLGIPVLAATTVADGTGRATFPAVPASPDACTKAYQAIELVTCGESQRLLAPP